MLIQGFAMSASRACIRLWIVASATWIIFWAWNYTTRCVRMHDMLWCPILGNDAIAPTGLVRMASNMLAPPLLSWLMGGLCLLAVRATHRHLVQDAPGPENDGAKRPGAGEEA